jgi:hypothetical protein
MIGVWCVHAEFDSYAMAFVQSSYFAIGWFR